MKKIIVHLLGWCILIMPIYAGQQSEADSLKKELLTAVDQQRSLILGRLSELCQKSDLKQSIAYDLENLEIQLRLNNRRDASSTLNNLGVGYYMQGDYQEALRYFEQSLNLREEFNDTINIVKTLNNLGVISQIAADYEKAIAYHKKSLLFKIALGDTLSIAKTMNNIGVVYMDLGKFEDARQFMQQALGYYLMKKDSSGIAASYNNLGQLFGDDKKQDSALNYYALSLEIKRKIHDQRGIGNTLNNMGMIYFEKNQKQKAIELFEEAMKIRTNLGDKFGLSSTLNNLANLYYSEKNYSEATRFFKESLKIAEQEQLKGVLQRNYSGLANLYNETGNKDEALKYYKLLNAIKDSIYKEDLNKQLGDLNLKYQHEKSKKENEILKKENQIQELQLKVASIKQWVLLTVLLLMLAGGFATFLVMKNKHHKRLTDELQRHNQELEDKVARRTSELENSNKSKDQLFSIIAHDLRSPFNSLLGLTELLSDSFDSLTNDEKKEFIKYTKESVETLYRLLENLLSWAMAQTGKLLLQPEPLEMEALIKDTLHIFHQQMLKKQIKPKIELETDEYAFADRETVKTILRNLISNAVKFTNEGGDVTVKCRLLSNLQHDKMIEITVTDNGVGISEEKLKILFDSPHKVKSPGTSFEKGTGLGLMLCKDFVEKNHGNLTVISETGKGSSFIFTLPVASQQAS